MRVLRCIPKYEQFIRISLAGAGIGGYLYIVVGPADIEPAARGALVPTMNLFVYLLNRLRLLFSPHLRMARAAAAFPWQGSTQLGGVFSDWLLPRSFSGARFPDPCISMRSAADRHKLLRNNEIRNSAGRPPPSWWAPPSGAARLLFQQSK